MLRWFFAMALGLAACAPHAAADVEQRLNALLTDTRTWKAEFVQIVHDEQDRLLQDARGLVYIQRPGRFRWDYRTPTPQLIVADGAKIWIYDEELEQVTVRALDAVISNTPALLLTHDGEVAEVFSLRGLGRRGALEWIELTPKAKDATFERFVLGVDVDQIRVMEMRDNFGQRTTLTFSDAERNQPIDAALFRFSPPAGTDVIEEK